MHINLFLRSSDFLNVIQLPDDACQSSAFVTSPSYGEVTIGKTVNEDMINH